MAEARTLEGCGGPDADRRCGLASTGETTRGWKYAFASGRAAHDLARRVAFAKCGVGSQLSDPAIYPNCAVDADVKPLDVANKLYEHLHATSPARPVIFTSALDDVASRLTSYRAAGAVVFLAKPFSDRSLVEALDHAAEYGITIVSMKNDWASVYAD